MANTVECPVCGMQVDPDNAPASDTYDDQTYVFSSTTCRDAFTEVRDATSATPAAEFPPTASPWPR